MSSTSDDEERQEPAIERDIEHENRERVIHDRAEKRDRSEIKRKRDQRRDRAAAHMETSDVLPCAHLSLKGHSQNERKGSIQSDGDRSTDHAFMKNGEKSRQRDSRVRGYRSMT